MPGRDMMARYKTTHLCADPVELGTARWTFADPKGSASVIMPQTICNKEAFWPRRHTRPSTPEFYIEDFPFINKIWRDEPEAPPFIVVSPTASKTEHATRIKHIDEHAREFNIEDFPFLKQILKNETDRGHSDAISQWLPDTQGLFREYHIAPSTLQLGHSDQAPLNYGWRNIPGLQDNIDIDDRTLFDKFFTLPRELRDEVYCYVSAPDPILDPVDIEIDYGEEVSHPYWLPAVYIPDSQFGVEATSVFLKTRNFIIKSSFDSEWFIEFLKSFPDDRAFNYIQRLEFPDFYSTSGLDVDVDTHMLLLEKCPALRELRLTIRHENWSRDARTAGKLDCDTEFCCKEDLIRYYSLDKLLSCRRLRKITWTTLCSKSWKEKHDLQSAGDILRLASQWLGQEFAKRRQRVEIEILDRPYRLRIWENFDEDY